MVSRLLWLNLLKYKANCGWEKNKGVKMPVSELRLIKHAVEFCEKEEIRNIPSKTRGIYVLFNYRPKLKKYDVVYIGMAAGIKAGGILNRLRTHRRGKKRKLWTHFSAFEVWDNIRQEEVEELEGMFRHIYQKDTRANRLNKQKGFKKLRRVIKSTRKEGWGQKNNRP
jgi:hypothetical protein